MMCFVIKATPINITDGKSHRKQKAIELDYPVAIQRHDA